MIEIEGKRVLEIGARDSQWLPYLSEKFPSSEFIDIDRSESDCIFLAKRAHEVGIKIKVICEDMFAENSNLHGYFDVMISYRVIEHFDDLGLALDSKKIFEKWRCPIHINSKFGGNIRLACANMES
jgi:2-polyprenyl-3-methyl-5-hydroxy-6-metoxy-1,4-benzoquinol methylase